ncbi:hypothetical protein [Kitasatospora sp. NBC_01302]|uniref:hypothetical protein n=1 Tax=Kitasatospora sp. NBC_01302 TaxID=2903575 RepID=UPI002E0E82CB|nr:hypothetical protein OG294_24725 [Kitasatospora sp. NBC_01302]
MSITITPVALAKSAVPALDPIEQAANLAERNFELGRQLDAARAELARRDVREVIWVDVVESLLGRVDELETAVVILECALGLPAA